MIQVHVYAAPNEKVGGIIFLELIFLDLIFLDREWEQRLCGNEKISVLSADLTLSAYRGWQSQI